MILDRSRWNVQYHQRMLATDPIAYWILDEKQGAVAYDWVTARAIGAQNGTHVGVTLGQPGIGDGRTSPLYDGANDYTDVFSAALVAAFSGGEGTLAIWARVLNAGVWIDGAARYVARLRVDVNNYITLFRSIVNNRFVYEYRAGGVTETIQVNGLTTVDWMHLAITWSASAGVNGEMIAYFDGAQTGATQVALGIWAGNLAATTTIIGAISTVGPLDVWDGTIAHPAIWDRALTPAEIASRAVVE